MFEKLKNIPCLYCFVLFFLFIVYITYNTTTHVRNVSIAVGTDRGAYYAYAKKYQEALKKYDVNLIIEQTKGAVEAQEKLEHDDKVLFALTQGGVEDLHSDIFALSNVAHEPIWVFYKDENIKVFEDLKDKIINVCRLGSGTEPVASEMLSMLLDINKSNIKRFPVNEAWSKLHEGQIDAMFYIIAKSSPALQKMIADKNIHIMDFNNSSSIQKFFIKDDMDSSKNRYFSTVTLEKNSISFVDKLPTNSKTLLVKRTILVTKGASDEMVRLFLKVAQEVHSHEAFFHEEEHFLNIYGLKFPQHPASKRYFENKEHHYERNLIFNNSWTCQSFWLAQSLKKVEDFILIFIIPLALMGFFIEVIYPISKIYTRRKINRWYRQINKLDTYFELFTLLELKEKKEELENILIEIQNTDNIDAIHLEAYYSLQLQIRQMLENFEKRIKEKRLKVLKKFKRKYEYIKRVFRKKK